MISSAPLPDWESPDPAEVVALTSEAQWKKLEERFGGLKPTPWQRCLKVARLNGARTAVLETRYVDFDYRAEYSSYHSKTFAAIPDTTLRAHFFSAQLNPKRLWKLPADPGYLGFVVLRPSKLGPVGRTVLKPPPDLIRSVTCSVPVTINFFGQPLVVDGVPFVQQDRQLGRCAQAAAWVCHYTASIRGEVQREPIAAFTLKSDDNQTLGRPVPSPGLTAQQLTNLLRDFGMSPVFYEIGRLPAPDDETPNSDPLAAIPVICRFLNSRYPVLICTDQHAFNLIGYSRERRPGKPDWITFVRHDDSLGPYLVVGNIMEDRPVPSGSPQNWRAILAPVPERLWLMPDAAEHHAKTVLLNFDQRYIEEDGISRRETLFELDGADRLTFRTYAIEASKFKAIAADRRLNQDLVEEYRMARMSRLVWVVEAVDKRRRSRGNASVVGEVVFDGTSSRYSPELLAVRAPGAAMVVQTSGENRYPIKATDRPTLSAAATQPDGTPSPW